MYTLGKLRHQKKSFSPQSEFRQDELKSQGVRDLKRCGRKENAFPPLGETSILT